ncbi:MAG: SusD/RagB family nutrient-binding outer membrane lipoprotein [Prevotellaceae bacterium]|jgi:hypothetical protein|nr:SusD/RagB family nutrient-binding outer membrane lipoprotein [Prevotellaceae bacterium]
MKKNLIILLITAVTLSSCGDWLDINHDPNALEEIPTDKVQVLLPAAEVGIANNLMGWHFGFGGGFWVQYWTQSATASQFKALCEYQPESFSTAYQSLLSQPLTDLERIKSMTAESGNKGYYFVAEALSIYTWQLMTDLWGDIPYVEALQGSEGVLHPKQDKQQDIYADLQVRVDKLLGIDVGSASIEGGSDFIFKGNMEQWYRFAGSLKLKLMLRLSETGDYDNEAVKTFIESADLLTVSASVPGSIWNDAMEGKRHPMREFQEGGANYFSTNVVACKSFFDYLLVNGDPRFAKLFSGTKAAFFGDFGSKMDSDGNGTTDDKETYAKVVLTANMDIPLISAWEVNFQLAEVYARAGNDAKAKEYYETGVKASLAQHGITGADSIVEAGGYAEWQSPTGEAAVKQIAMQKWVANCNYQHAEAFIERNRTKYPSVNDIDIASNRQSAWDNFPVGELTISVAGRGTLNGKLPASPTYPEAYISRNNNAPAQKANIGEPVWWNQKAGK